MAIFKLPSIVVVELFLGVVLSVVAIRHFAYKLYLRCPNTHRTHQAILEREINFYWKHRSQFLPRQLATYYGLWILTRIDRYIPIVDCDRQVAKAQYFHNYGFYGGMRGFQYRYNNRKLGERKISDAERFSLALSQIAGKRLTYAEVTGKVGETTPD